MKVQFGKKVTFHTIPTGSTYFGNCPTLLFKRVDNKLTSTNQKLSQKPSRTPLVNNNIINYCPKPYYCISPLPEPHAFTTNIRLINQTTRADLSLQHVVAPQNSSKAIQTNSWHQKINHYHQTDSNHTLEIFHVFDFLGENKTIFTVHVALLYPEVPNNEGLSVLKHFLTNEPFINLVPRKHYFHPPKTILTLNSIAFSNK